MTRAIVSGYNLAECEAKYRRYCYALNIPYRPQECVMLSSKMSLPEKRMRITGYYNDVLEGRVDLVGLTLQEFKFLYLREAY